MKYKVEVKNPCRCFLRDGMAETQEFENEEEAAREAEQMLQHMKDNFCKKHEFDLHKDFTTYTIYIKPRR